MLNIAKNLSPNIRPLTKNRSGSATRVKALLADKNNVNVYKEYFNMGPLNIKMDVRL